MGASRTARRARTATVLSAALLLPPLLTGGCTPDDGRKPRERVESGSYFTGLEARGGPVLGVKIDNAAPARPQTGLERADIVYVERVEAGLSRLLAVYAAHKPERVGPVRSARETDLALLEQFGRPALAFSGGQSDLLPLIDEAPLFPVPHGEADDAYVRGTARPAPHNLFVRPGKALAAAPDADSPRDIGFRFGAPPRGGRATTERTVRYPAASFGFTWDATAKRWLVSFDGSPAGTAAGGRLSAATVVVQHVEIRDSDFTDGSGNVSPFTETVGAGKAEVLRGGRSYPARWERESAGDGTEFTDADGERLRFARGPVWVVFTE
ncbi:DUF3048 domain-containing protein [Streptomyces sp. WMMC500]|uniref:DUF3048 domain-containing protein n=1 Tax=Streptomyces sp. WMMC500 TaxID=3015154 RepID=UPI00248BBE49|nr:DUF3048 domain-containing protein [Streptomyces sp. WMMC500]WBB60557.1 DUF3048 domain-containing protein [Streptomyces sp. WMMC500]